MGSLYVRHTSGVNGIEPHVSGTVTCRANVDYSTWNSNLKYIVVTLCCICLSSCYFGLETRVIIKISKNPCYPINFVLFSWEWSKFVFFLKMKIKMADSKRKWVFQLRQFSKIFLWKFQIGPWVNRINWWRGINGA